MDWAVVELGTHDFAAARPPLHTAGSTLPATLGSSSTMGGLYGSHAASAWRKRCSQVSRGP